jgi:peptidoglycan/LPS O-acetylase OafA/YrhL
MSSIPSREQRYVAEIDGLRAIAVLAVMLFHGELGLPGGYVGVDVFFVISGYLITGLILQDVEADRFQLLTFWERRVRRIMPALVPVLLACVAAGWCRLFPFDFKQLGASVFAQALLISNVNLWHASGYFAEASELKPLLHTWSLAVEQQFYVLFPLLFTLLGRWTRQRLRLVLALLAAMSFGLSVYLSFAEPSLNFYSLPSRAWELLLGAYLAAMPVRPAGARWLDELVGWGGVAAIGAAMLCYGRGTRFPGSAALLPCLGAALTIWATASRCTILGRLLSVPPVTFIGMISYSLYLWHWPLLVFARYSSPDPIPGPWRLLLLLASVGLATLSWMFFETPIRKRWIFPTRGHIFAFTGVATLLLVGIGLGLHRLEGLPSRIDPAVLHYAAAKYDRPYDEGLNLQQARAGELLELGKGGRQQPIDFVLWGDSFAMSMVPLFKVLCDEYSLRGVAAMHSATAPLLGYQSRGPQSLKESVALSDAIVDFIRAQQIRNVLLIANWDGYLSHDGTPDRLHRSLLETLRILNNNGCEVWIMREVPGHSRDVPRALALVTLRHGNPEMVGATMTAFREAFERESSILADVPSALSGVTILDPSSFFTESSGFCRVAEMGKSLYFDRHHLSAAGAMFLRPLFEPVVASFVSSRHK